MVSRVTQKQFKELLAEHNLTPIDIEFPLLSTKTVQPFMWDPNMKEDAHADGYLQWLKDNIDLPSGVEFYRASNKKDLLTTTVASSKFILKGTTDTAIIRSVSIKNANYAAGILVAIEEKKHVEDKDNMQAILELISANLSSRSPVTILLTDLGSTWRFFWLQPSVITISTFNLDQGVTLLETIVREACEDQSALEILPDAPYRARCTFREAIAEENVALPEELVLEGKEALWRRPKVDIMGMLPKKDVADMSEMFDVMTPEEINEWQRKQVLDFVMHVPAFQPYMSENENWRSMYA